MKTIPVIGIPIVNRGDYLLRLFDSIGDFSIGKICIINNGNSKDVAEAIDEIKNRYESKSELDIVSPGENWGCAKSWNYILKKHMNDYVWMAANDVAFRPGDVEKIYEWQEKDRVENLGKLGTINYTNVGYGFWVINSTHFERMGTFDENFYPAYYEDMDYNRRMYLMDQECQRGIRSENVSMRDIPDVKMIHCNENSEINPDKVIDYESSTIHSDPKLKEANDITFWINLRYYTQKWGGDRRKECWANPYGEPENDINFWKIDPELRKELDVWNNIIFNEK